MDKWYNAVQAQINLAKYLMETAKILHKDIFWFFLKDEDFVSRTISDGSVDLDKFPASRVCQLAKKYESSKATVRHIKTSIWGTSKLPKSIYCTIKGPSYHNIGIRRKGPMQNPDQVMVNWPEMTSFMANPHYKNKGDHKLPMSKQMPLYNNSHRCSKCSDTAHCDGFTCSARKYQCKACHKFGHFH